ncbi:MAG: response regulator [Alphaproteobacteria bacterium]|nr:response regulator [Alphaproteobacteria bacterium]
MSDFSATNTQDTSKVRVMVVEDTESHMLLAHAALERFGITPIAAVNYNEAIEYITHNSCDLILMDLQLPAKSGYEITYEIRRLEHEGQKPRTPIVAVTAFMLDDAAERCRNAGMDDCVSKPLSIPLCQQIFDKYLPEANLKAQLG